MQIERIGRYEVKRIVGYGAAGIVYQARDPLIDREVALKTLRVDLDPELAGGYRQRFLREARAAGRLSHPNIVTIFDVGEDEESGVAFIAMELLEGTNLKEIIAAGARLEVRWVVHLAITLAGALDYAHRQGVVHRDIKPANVILTADGRVKLTDFGVARMGTSDLTAQGGLVGTPFYMAPEQIKSKPADPRSDIYALGVILFELLAGKRPFTGPSLPELSMQIVERPPPNLDDLRPDLPEGLAAIINTCLDKDPDERFQSGNQLAFALARLGLAFNGAIAEPEVAETQVDVSAEPSAEPPARRGVSPPPEPAEPEAALTQPAVPWDTADDVASRRTAVMRRRVAGHWFWTVVIVWAGLWAAALGVLATMRDTGPFTATPSARAEELHAVVDTLREAVASLDRGDLDAARASASRVLEVDPRSRTARRVVAEVRRLERERMRPTPHPTPHPTPRAARPRPTPPAGTQARRPATVAVEFNSPIGRGTLVLSVDGKPVQVIPFDFSRRTVLGIKRRGKGKVVAALQVPAGRHGLGVELRDGDGAMVGTASFDQSFAEGASWQLNVDMPRRKSEPIFTLAPVGG